MHKSVRGISTGDCNKGVSDTKSTSNIIIIIIIILLLCGGGLTAPAAAAAPVVIGPCTRLRGRRRRAVRRRAAAPGLEAATGTTGLLILGVLALLFAGGGATAGRNVNTNVINLNTNPELDSPETIVGI